MRVLISHPGKQHSYQTAIAVEHMGADLMYCTTVYDKPGSITHFVKNFLRGIDRSKAETRSCAQISNEKIFQKLEYYGLYQLLMSRICKSKRKLNRINDKLNDRFGAIIAKLAKDKNVNVVISYNSNSMIIFEELKRKQPNIIRILDMSAPNEIFMKEIYEKDCKIEPEFSKKLQRECPILNEVKQFERKYNEIQLAQYFLVGSTFVKRSLEYSGVKPEQIYICPYGVDTSTFNRKKELTKRMDDDPIRFVFVGGTKELKGLSYMLKAFQMVDHRKAKFTIIGNDDLELTLKKKYAKDVIFTGIVLHDKMPELLQNFDVMIFPSLGDGFGLSVTEAMACGLPVIASDNTGASDFIVEGENGFVIPIQNSVAITEKMQWFIEHREKIPKMGLNAINTAKKMTWENYYEKVGRAIEEIVTNEKKMCNFNRR